MTTFEKTAPEACYFLQGLARTGYEIAFCPAEASEAASLELAATWTNGSGVYLFLDAGRTDLAADFEASVRRLLADAAFRDARFVWIEGAAGPMTGWRVQQIAVAPPDADGVGRLLQRTGLDLRNYTLTMARGTRCRLVGNSFVFDDGAFGLTTGYGAHRLDAALDAVTLSFEEPSAGCLTFGLTLRRSVDDRYDALADLDAAFRIFYKDGAFATSTDAYLVASRRYAFFAEDAAAWSDDDADTDLRLDATLDLHAPLDANRSHFAFGAAPVPARFPSGFRTILGYTVHLAALNDDSRLVFAAQPPSSRDDDTPPLSLVPSGDFEMTVPRPGESATLADDEPDDNLLCGLSGVEYVKLVAEETNVLRFTPGQTAFAPAFRSVAGSTDKLLRMLLDCVDVDLAVGDPVTVLNADTSLDPLTPALDNEFFETLLDTLGTYYFPDGFVFDTVAAIDTLNQIVENEGTLGDLVAWFQREFLEAADDTTRDAPAFSDDATTAWVYVQQTGDDAPIYYAQPDRAVLYRAVPETDTTKNIGGDEFLEYLEVPAVALPDDPPEETPHFPLFPYGSIETDGLTDYRQLELQWLSVLRRARLHELGDTSLPLLPGGDGAASVEAATPQGFLATFTGDFETLENLALAKDTDAKELHLQNLPRTAALRAALQSNQLFLVISDPAQLSEFFTQDILTIEGWGFDLNPEDWAKHDTMLVFKFHDKSMLELIENTQAWTMPEVFCGDDLDGTRRRLARLLKNAVANAESTDLKVGQRYAPLARAAQLDSWAGVLGLNVAVGGSDGGSDFSSGLPEEIRGLAGGIDGDKFFAQFVGIETTPITPDGVDLVAGQSSLFALIDYTDDGAPLPSDSGFNFQVTRLAAFFENSALREFTADLAVTLDTLFDEPTTLLNSDTGRNIILLKGSSENHDGTVVYTFSFSGDNHFALPEASVFEEVEIVKAQYTTDPPESLLGQVRSRFTFWGNLRFRRPGAFDILSFGPEPQSANGEDGDDHFLSFSNLEVIMTFPESDASNRTFDFEPRNLAFDLKRSSVRAQSLFAKFPLKLIGLTYSEGDKPIDDLGFMPVKTPNGGSAPDADATWYGLTFDFEMGTLGALSGGALTASLIAAWIPAGGDDESGGGVYVGLHLPGSTGGKKEISLQGVFKLVFKTIQFVATEDEAEETTAYLLKLKNIVLKAFVVSLPPSAQTEIVLFGNPDATPDDRTLGWYAAYAKT